MSLGPFEPYVCKNCLPLRASFSQKIFLLTSFMTYFLYTFPMKSHKCVTCMTQFLPLHYHTVMGISWWSHLVLFQPLKRGHRLSKYSQNCQLLVTQKHAGSGVLSSRLWRRGCLMHTDLHCLSPFCPCTALAPGPGLCYLPSSPQMQ